MTASTQSGILHTSDSNNSALRASQEAIEASAGLYEAAEALLLGLLCWMRRVGLLILRCRVPGVTSFINWGCSQGLGSQACMSRGSHAQAVQNDSQLDENVHTGDVCSLRK